MTRQTLNQFGKQAKNVKTLLLDLVPFGRSWSASEKKKFREIEKDSKSVHLEKNLSFITILNVTLPWWWLICMHSLKHFWVRLGIPSHTQLETTMWLHYWLIPWLNTLIPSIDINDQRTLDLICQIHCCDFGYRFLCIKHVSLSGHGQ